MAFFSNDDLDPLFTELLEIKDIPHNATFLTDNTVMTSQDDFCTNIQYEMELDFTKSFLVNDDVLPDDLLIQLPSDTKLDFANYDVQNNLSQKRKRDSDVTVSRHATDSWIDIPELPTICDLQCPETEFDDFRFDDIKHDTKQDSASNNKLEQDAPNTSNQMDSNKNKQLKNPRSTKQDNKLEYNKKRPKKPKPDNNEHDEKQIQGKKHWNTAAILSLISKEIILGDTKKVPPNGRCYYCSTRWPGGIHAYQRWSVTTEGHCLCRSCNMLLDPHRDTDSKSRFVLTYKNKEVPPFPRGVPKQLTYGVRAGKCTIANPKYDEELDSCIICKSGSVRNKFEFWNLCSHMAHPGCLVKQHLETKHVNCLLCNTRPKRADIMKYIIDF